MGTGSFAGVKRPGRGLERLSRLKKVYSYTSTAHLGLSGLFESEVYI